MPRFTSRPQGASGGRRAGALAQDLQRGARAGLARVPGPGRAFAGGRAVRSGTQTAEAPPRSAAWRRLAAGGFGSCERPAAAGPPPFPPAVLTLARRLRRLPELRLGQERTRRPRTRGLATAPSRGPALRRPAFLPAGRSPVIRRRRRPLPEARLAQVLVDRRVRRRALRGGCRLRARLPEDESAAAGGEASPAPLHSPAAGRESPARSHPPEARWQPHGRSRPEVRSAPRDYSSQRPAPSPKRIGSLRHPSATSRRKMAADGAERPITRARRRALRRPIRRL
ncbi:uncharacterized protein C10orf143 homolog isoform X1 [Lutra lutra]|uniref:uncharacterized protein C10orf143 homolog isoform X1 n=1 Tax=Lutra lutra TaxID=9657 RepID=UPI001FD40698|nr:uncharacterized protein C10orf143 homolog isoform X1 [Lutra lutra]XP_047558146.1 uncharacterized protein C10orf143 homolog isoform X1 [Lutra lutra]XP_047558147.1 uncharacterized protein C10orf143 homolog isoform X1 [Lutra lutra]XP_047558148.1 uncharacterized protein C10orf143 homolog isoform X1 [Lutra lutra]